MIDNDNNNNNNNNDINDNINQNLKFHSSGSYGIVLLNEKTNKIYKLTKFAEQDEIIPNNFIEMLYLNYFKNKYQYLYNDKSNSFLPIQNINTFLCYLDDFVNIYKLEKKIFLQRGHF